MVALLMRSIRMKPPVSRTFSYGSNAIGRSTLSLHTRDLVQRELLRREMLQRVHIHLVLDVGDRGGDGARADLHQIGAAGQQRFVLIHTSVASNWSATSAGEFGGR
jgi:hypothetical protein